MSHFWNLQIRLRFCKLANQNMKNEKIAEIFCENLAELGLSPKFEPMKIYYSKNKILVKILFIQNFKCWFFFSFHWKLCHLWFFLSTFFAHFWRWNRPLSTLLLSALLEAWFVFLSLFLETNIVEIIWFISAIFGL